jgi:hypothetical protein
MTFLSVCEQSGLAHKSENFAIADSPATNPWPAPRLKSKQLNRVIENGDRKKVRNAGTVLAISEVSPAGIAGGEWQRQPRSWKTSEKA